MLRSSPRRRERGQVKLKPSQASLSECCSHTWEERAPPCPYPGGKLRLKTLCSAFAHSLLMETDTQQHSHESWSCPNFLPSNPPQLWASSRSGTICSLVVFLASKPPLPQASIFPVSPGSQPALCHYPRPGVTAASPGKEGSALLIVGLVNTWQPHGQLPSYLHQQHDCPQTKARSAPYLHGDKVTPVLLTPKPF